MRRPGRAMAALAVLAASAAVAYVASAVVSAHAATSPSITIGPNEARPEPGEEQEVNRDVPNSRSAAHVPSSHVPRPDGLPVDGSPGLGTSFEGLNHYDQRIAADGGNQFSLEPPDQGLCVGKGTVLEPVNTVVRTYDTSGSPTSGVVSLTKFFTGQSQIIRDPSVAEPFGPFLSDPKCYFDPGLQRFFMTVLEIDQDPATGAFTGHTSELIAVSKTSSANLDRSNWWFYAIDTTNAGGLAQGEGGAPRTLPTHPGCPCLGDQPLIGADQYGFYITTNEFSLEGPEFNGAQVYAMDKRALTEGTLKLDYVAGTEFLPLAEGPAYSIQPATSPTAGEWETENGGTEYFLSALDFDATLDNRIAVWALTNTSSLATDNPDVQFTNAILPSEVYGQPPDAEQKDGPTPLAQVVLQLQGVKNPKSSASAKEELLAGNDDRMNQVVYADGLLWSGVNSVVKTRGENDVGIAYFVVSPSVSGDQVGGDIARQGYVAVDKQNVLYPSIGVTAAGDAVMTFTLAGPDYYPTAAYATLSASSGPDAVNIAGAGVGPDDGFTGYAPFGGPTGRWGDYSAAVADGSGNVWIATEYIAQSCTLSEFLADPTCGGTRSLLANWSTRVASVTP